MLSVLRANSDSLSVIDRTLQRLCGQYYHLIVSLCLSSDILLIVISFFLFPEGFLGVPIYYFHENERSFFFEKSK